MGPAAPVDVHKNSLGTIGFWEGGDRCGRLSCARPMNSPTNAIVIGVNRGSLSRRATHTIYYFAHLSV